ncbi:hypothetical protein DN824_09380 [Stutzerimonas nosocomialis]|uniref:Uncharacterized protein n=1 Tax=Stutzerimonas nosocomialis TaxID=1056496 RepID=A0A5R9QDN2_9GAMM|nr:hypothetical protein [Stutzerimonas nosocomialis]TLX54259.1 hypothetical protein DN826_14525 [Stutzerimonas nosocomialis]TLX58780.1 hypothetical protein DN824_09380 [Stutzerimonas nosocomialis]TLX63247.1 hypothetical protein DN820_11980 [Stutzerimonas nosocomialis]
MIAKLRIILTFALAVAFATAIGSITQTQFNLAALQTLGAQISLPVRMRATGNDLLGFSPAYAAIVGVTLLCALPIAALVSRFLPVWRLPVYFLAGGVGLLVAFQIADAFAPMPTLIAATRTPSGTAAMMLSGAFGGLLFATLLRPRP